MPRIDLSDIALDYRIDGSGDDVLVLVNGLADSKESWAGQFPAFAERYQVVSYDNRGVGGSDAPLGPYTTAQMAADLHGLVDALGLDRFHLLGTSMGGMIAQEYAIAHADRLRSASFCNTYAAPGPFCLKLIRIWRDLAPTMGVGFTQREILVWAFTTGFFEDREAEMEQTEAELAANDMPLEPYLA